MILPHYFLSNENYKKSPSNLCVGRIWNVTFNPIQTHEISFETREFAIFFLFIRRIHNKMKNRQRSVFRIIFSLRRKTNSTSFTNMLFQTCLEECNTDSQTDILQRSARCVQRFDDSRNSAIHTTYRISLRSSSLREPRDPLSKVVISLGLFFSFWEKKEFSSIKIKWFNIIAGVCPHTRNKYAKDNIDSHWCVEKEFWKAPWVKGPSKSFQWVLDI